MSDVPPPPQAPPAGWYSDPEQPGTQRYWDGGQWTEQRAPAVTSAPGVQLDPLVVLLAVGGLGMVGAAFLPFVDSSQFLQVAENTLIQQGSGWVFLGLGLVAIVLAYRAHGGIDIGWKPVVVGVVGVALAIYMGVSEEVRTLTSATDTRDLNLLDALDVQSREEVANPGVGVYVAGIASAVVAVMGLRLR